MSDNRMLYEVISLKFQGLDSRLYMGHAKNNLLFVVYKFKKPTQLVLIFKAMKVYVLEIT